MDLSTNVDDGTSGSIGSVRNLGGHGAGVVGGAGTTGRISLER